MNNNFLQVQQPLTTPQNSQIDKLADLMKSQSGLVLLGCFASIGIFRLISGNNHKGKVATSYWGGSREKSQAARKAKKQIFKPTRNSVGLYVGTPPYIRTALQKRWYSNGFIKN
ncbi:MAG: type IV secretory system conjugative DNA transfer family protein, partial [Richelia sp. RM2_1_2]|nr:type IV secretory system conjugative DNA transfer family protein [Richelia sp. RM2_1_2]